MAERIDSFPLFPLGLVLLPGEVLPLHIFENRYKTMIDICLEEERDFGIVWLSDDGLKDVGCTTRITELVERTHDGRMNIVTEGDQPFRLLQRVEALPYPAGDIELLEDDDEEPSEDALSRARERYSELVFRATDERPPEDELVLLDAYGMVATVAFPPEPKQDLLELRSEEERLAAVSELFETTMRRIDYTATAGERARSNGHVDHG